MSLPASTYAQAGPPQATQFAAGQPNATNSQAPQGSPMQAQPTPNLSASSPNLDQAMSSATTQLGDMQTPGNRQAYLSNSQLPGMQSNYDDLAKQLYNYDKSISSSNVADPNAAAPSDAVSYGNLVAPSSLQQTPGSLGAMGTFKFSNPGYGISTQTEQKNSIGDLLSILNNSIAKEFRSREGTYASTVQSQKDVVGIIKDLMGQRNDLAMKQAELDLQKIGISNQRQDRFQAQADKTLAQLKTGDISWGDAWNQLKTYADKIGADVSPTDIDQALGGKYNAADPDGSKGLTTGWAKPGAYQDYNAQKKLSSGTMFSDKEMGELDSTAQATQLAQQAIQILKAHPEAAGGIQGTIYDKLAQSGAPQLIPDENARALAGILVKLKGLGDKTLVGGRLTGQLINIFNSGQPGVARNSADNIKMLNQLISFAQQDAQAKAQSNRVGVTELPHYGEIFGSTGTNTPNSAVTSASQKLKAAGYNDTQINAYLKQKGLQ